MKYPVVTFCILFSSLLFAANADSLRNVVRTSKNDSLRLDANNKLIWHYLFSDSKRAESLIQKSEKIASKGGLAYGWVDLQGIHAIYFDLAGQKDSALFYFNRAYKEAKRHHFIEQESFALTNLGMYHWNQGNNEKALDYFFKAVRLADKIENPKFKDKSTHYNNIGLIYQELKLETKALKYHQKALKERRDRNNLPGLARSYNNIGICYENLGKLDEALNYFNKGVQVALETNDLTIYYQLQNGIATVKLLKGDHQKALEIYKQSLNRPESVPFSNLDRISTYNNLAHTFILLKKPDSSIYYADLALRFQDENLDIKVNYPELYQWKGQAYFMKGDVDLGSAYLDTFASITLQKFNDKSAKYLQELEVEYESEKREKNLAEKQIEIQKRNNIIILISALLAIISILFLLFYLRKNAKNKKLLLEKELSQARLEIEAKEQLYSQRLEISRDLHDNIGSQLTFISSAVDQLDYEEFNHVNSPEKIASLRFFIKQVFQELRDTVWAMNQETITGEDLHERIIRLVEQVNQSQHETSVQLQVESNGLKHFQLNSKACINLLAIVKESLNNAVKHANATEIQISIDFKSSVLEVNVSDNGTGFSLESPADGFGLENMRRRAKTIGGEFELTSNEEGTSIRIRLDKKQVK